MIWVTHGPGQESYAAGDLYNPGHHQWFPWHEPCLHNAHRTHGDNTHPDTDGEGVQRNVAAAAPDYRAALSLRLRHSWTHPPSRSSKYFAFCDFIIYSKCIFVSPGSERDLKPLPHSPVLCDRTNHVPCAVCVCVCVCVFVWPQRPWQGGPVLLASGVHTVCSFTASPQRFYVTAIGTSIMNRLIHRFKVSF